MFTPVKDDPTWDITAAPAFEQTSPATPDVQVPVQIENSPAYKPEANATELLRKAAEKAKDAKRDLQGTLDRVFDVYETPNAFQVFWVIVFLLSIGIFVLSAIVTVSYGNSLIVAASIASATLLFVGLVGYLIYKPKSLSLSLPSFFASKAKGKEEYTPIDTRFRDEE